MKLFREIKRRACNVLHAMAGWDARPITEEAVTVTTEPVEIDTFCVQRVFDFPYPLGTNALGCMDTKHRQEMAKELGLELLACGCLEFEELAYEPGAYPGKVIRIRARVARPRT